MPPGQTSKQPREFPGQSSIEFLYAVGMILVLFTIAALLFYLSGEDASALAAYVETQRACTEAAAQVEAVSSAGDGASATLRMPQGRAYDSFAFFFSSENRSLSVVYAGTPASCGLSTTDLKNASGAYAFNITGDSPIRNIGGGVVIG